VPERIQGESAASNRGTLSDIRDLPFRRVGTIRHDFESDDSGAAWPPDHFCGWRVSSKSSAFLTSEVLTCSLRFATAL
jgi:hypothetical protein